MKKLFKIMMVATMLSVSASSAIYAEEAINEPIGHVNTSNEKIIDLETIEKMFQDFIKENNLKSRVGGIRTVQDTDGNYHDFVYGYILKSESKMIDSFISENNIDQGRLLFFGYGGGVSTFCIGDANMDGITDIRDAAYIASKLAENDAGSLPESADYNEDGKINVRDASVLAKELAAK